MAQVFFIGTNFTKTTSLRFGILNFNILDIISFEQQQIKIYPEVQLKHALSKCG